MLKKKERKGSKRKRKGVVSDTARCLVCFVCVWHMLGHTYQKNIGQHMLPNIQALACYYFTLIFFFFNIKLILHALYIFFYLLYTKDDYERQRYYAFKKALCDNYLDSYNVICE